MSANSQNVNFDNLTDDQIDNLYNLAVDSTPSVDSPSHSPSVNPSRRPSVNPSHIPSVNPSHIPSVNPSHSPKVHSSYSPSTLQPIRSSRSNNDSDLNEELQQLKKKNKDLQRKLKIASVPKPTAADNEAFVKEANQNYAAYKNAQATAEYYNQRAKQREKSGYVDPFFSRPTISFVSSVPTGNAMCSQTNSRSSFTGVHLMGGCRSNVAVGLIGVYGSR